MINSRIKWYVIEGLNGNGISLAPAVSKIAIHLHAHLLNYADPMQ